jgi:hypothetical protein
MKHTERMKGKGYKCRSVSCQIITVSWQWWRNKWGGVPYRLAKNQCVAHICFHYHRLPHCTMRNYRYGAIRKTYMNTDFEIVLWRQMKQKGTLMAWWLELSVYSFLKVYKSLGTQKSQLAVFWNCFQHFTLETKTQIQIIIWSFGALELFATLGDVIYWKDLLGLKHL